MRGWDIVRSEPRAPFTVPRVSWWERDCPARIVPIDYCKRLSSQPSAIGFRPTELVDTKYAARSHFLVAELTADS